MRKAGSGLERALDWARAVRIQIGTLSLELRLGQRATILHSAFQASTSPLFDSWYLNMQNGYVSFKEKKYGAHSFKKKKKDDLEELMVLV